MSTIKSFPSAADLDLDMWQTGGPTAGRVGWARRINSGDDPVADVYGVDVATRDVTARRIESLGDLYDTLRELADRARAAGLDISQAVQVLNEIVAPKPFHEPGKEG